ncbi:ABC-type glycine betaine/proline transport system, inner membrane permease protein [Desulforapulum autotrophicum HRM2]|uniref:ABC-type glycine betaine/proline transport system, inner membrane permease protein n=1 Tax=Desulforapulum autotrophicum (strain ATCC 43914 / DSM 3382 / VKM B-1955 / HRM2) TaxID=177437 RepID=C0QK22_DESAH|nr:ABC transporter permease [Desulforapulum autotrophicum]ACN16048.1 ABC-type glycine betaine/proline transport system, inner membrane permease protein [Desulforapulum autotrophicum HRM2]
MNRLFTKSYRILIAVIILIAGVTFERTGLIELLSDPYEYPVIMELFLQHLHMVSLSMIFATIIGVTAGIVLTRQRFRKYTGLCMYIIGLGQTIPSLAVLALAMSFLGLGLKPAVFALTIYSILPIARNTLAGITAVPPELIDAGKGMGMPPMRILMEVEIPNAMKVILTGFRVALIINIGTAALAYVIGAGGLGDLIFTGINLMQTDKLLAGAIPVTLLALFADFLSELLGIALISKGLRLSK